MKISEYVSKVRRIIIKLKLYAVSATSKPGLVLDFGFLLLSTYRTYTVRCTTLTVECSASLLSFTGRGTVESLPRVAARGMGV